MICKDCGRDLNGGFGDATKGYQCAKCVIREIEHDSDRMCVQSALTIFNELLRPGYRPRKYEIDEGARWIRTLENRWNTRAPRQASGGK